MRMPTLGEFIRQAVELYGAKLHESKGTIIGPDGKQTKPRYLTRNHNGKALHVVLPDMQDNEGLVPTVLRSLSDRLGIGSGLYPGMRLTDDGFEYDDSSKLH